jgi:APA family basic amino acid/polyamine antiporter
LSLREIESVSAAPQSGATQDDGSLHRYIKLRSAVALVVANVIGAGIFTTTGFQAADLGHPGLIFGLWITGGILAFCGALCYAELGASTPGAGAEYVYLRDTYGPVFGFMSALVSLVAGFSAPIAAAAKAFVRYLSFFLPGLEAEPLMAAGLTWNDAVALALVWGLVAVQLRGARSGMRLGDGLTLFKLVGLVTIIVAAFAFGRGSLSNLTVVSQVYSELGSAERYAALGTSLIFVMFCYSGWNASAYVASEFENPQRDLPRGLLMGTAIVVVVYLAINVVYFYGADVDELAGKVEVGLVASRALFGDTGAGLVTVVLLVSLIAAASAMTIAGPRVYYALGRDYKRLAFLSRSNATSGAPVNALLVQGLFTSAILLVGRIDQIQQYSGFTLTLFASLAVSCVIVRRIRQPELPRPFRVWLYPLTPLLFLVVSVWMMFWALRGRPMESLLALATVGVAGALFYGARDDAEDPAPRDSDRGSGTS